MDRRRLMWIAGVSGALFAVSVVLFAWQLSASGHQGGRPESAERQVDVLVAAATIAAGDRITDLNVTVKAIPKSLVPEGALLTGDLRRVKGHRVGLDLGRGEILTDARVAPDTSPLDSIRPGYTAITVAVDPVRALGGEATVGMQVDVMVEESIGTVSTIASDVRIVSTSVRVLPESGPSLVSTPSGAAGDITWVTLEVPNESVAAVVAASGAGSVHLVCPATEQDISRG